MAQGGSPRVDNLQDGRPWTQSQPCLSLPLDSALCRDVLFYFFIFCVWGDGWGVFVVLKKKDMVLSFGCVHIIYLDFKCFICLCSDQQNKYIMIKM